MWLAKIFGGRRTRAQDIENEEPARVRVDHASEITTMRDQKRRATTIPPTPKPSATKPKGFDPYNSGTFEKKNAWERVTRK